MAGKLRHYTFTDELAIDQRSSVFINTAANADLGQLGTTSAVSRAYFRVLRPGRITDISFVGEDGITQNGTNFQTFTGLNLGPTGTGDTSVLVTTAHHNTTDTDAAALNGGSNLTAKKPYSLELSGTAANLVVAAGDIIQITATAASAGAVVDAATCFLQITGLPQGLRPTAVRVGGSSTLAPTVAPVLSSAGGEAILTLAATNEAQSARLDWGDQVCLNPANLPYFACRLKLSAVAAVNRMVWGLASAYNATLDSIVSNVWFKLDGNSLALVVEGDDGTTDTDDQSAALSLVADTYYNFEIDFRGGLSAVRFLVNGVSVGTVSVPLLTVSTLLQPFILVQKDSGTASLSVTVDTVTVG